MKKPNRKLKNIAQSVRKLFFGALLISCAGFARAQTLPDTAIHKQQLVTQPDSIPDQLYCYGDFGIGFGSHFTIQLGLNVIFNHNNAISAGLAYNSRKDPHMPSDYRRGLFESYPHEHIAAVGAMYGKVYYVLHSSGRIIVRGGLSLDIIETPAHYRSAGGGLFGSNYEYDVAQNLIPGIAFNPTMELPLWDFLGLSLGIYSNINSSAFVLSGGAAILFGKLPRQHIAFD